MHEHLVARSRLYLEAPLDSWAHQKCAFFGAVFI